MKFKELKIDDTFDFIKPDSIYNSFFLKCIKISRKRYQDTWGYTHTIGSINAEVYHVNEKED